MSRDEDLRALERAVALGGAVESRLRYASALERAGRRDDALAALAPAASDPAVRAELARAPAWRQRDGDPGRTRFVDVAAVESEPELLWRRSEFSGPTPPFWGLLAGPLGVVAIQHPARPVVLDPLTGEPRWRSPRPFTEYTPPELELLGDLLLVIEGRDLFVHELSTGAEALAVSLPGHVAHIAAAAGAVVVQTDAALEVLSYADPRQAPGPPTATIGGRSVQVGGGILSAGARLLIQSEHDVDWFDLPRAHLVRRVRGSSPRLDEHGVVAFDAGLVVYDAEGRRVFALEEALYPAALAPPVVVASRGSPIMPGGRKGTPVVLVGRASGEARETGVNARALAVVREMVYAATATELVAIRLTGEVAWRLDARELAPGSITRLAPLSRGVCGLTEDGTLFCLG